MRDFIVKYWLEALFGLVVAGTGAICKMLHKKTKGRDVKLQLVTDGIKALLRDRIIQTYNYHLEKGYCPIYAKENVEEMYQEYHCLGGNGTITQLYDELMKMPTDLKGEEQ